MEKNRIYLGQVSDSEANEIEMTIERLNGLEELMLIVTEHALKRKITKEISELRAACNSWWEAVAGKNKWNLPPESSWEIEFSNNKVWQIKKECP